MNTTTPTLDLRTQTEGSAADPTQPRQLPSGRSVVVKVVGDTEELEIRSPQGEVEVHITLTETGPVVKLSGARLELTSPAGVAINCPKFEVNATESMHLHADAEVKITGHNLRVKTVDETRINSKPIRLNCPEEEAK